MKGLMLNKPSKVGRNSYFNMIGDDLIIPSERSLRLDEFYFKERAKKVVGNPNTKGKAKDLLRSKASGVYFEPLWEDTLSIENLTQRVSDASKLAMESLQKAKNDRQGAIDSLGKLVGVTMKTARERVDQAISRGAIDDTLKNATTKNNVKASIEAINQYVYYWTVADAYTAEINKRVTNSELVKRAIAKGDIPELKALRSKVSVKELKTNIDEAIKSIEDAKKAEEEKQKAIAEANRKLTGATTPEEKAAAQAELDALLRAGSEGAAAISRGTGLSKGVVYIGIGLVVFIGAYLMFRKKA